MNIVQSHVEITTTKNEYSIELNTKICIVFKDRTQDLGILHLQESAYILPPRPPENVPLCSSEYLYLTRLS